MTHLLTQAIRRNHREIRKVTAVQYKCLHTSLLACAANDDYDAIKLSPFIDKPYDGSIERWRRHKRLPQHVENMHWREQHGLPMYLNSCGPLTDKPDYSYVDETLKRPPTLGTGQKKRLLEQHEHAKNIIQFIKELDYGKIKYQNKLKAAEEEKQQIISSKLKPKGEKVL